ncbi:MULTISPECIES: ubiquitin-like domain-containing protein [Streptomyces]|uniref:ubiquitin-like domain-containing protein n=1 Tax=Streptomyces TaxID=1883 RepID=UPI003720D455
MGHVQGSHGTVRGSRRTGAGVPAGSAPRSLHEAATVVARVRRVAPPVHDPTALDVPPPRQAIRPAAPAVHPAVAPRAPARRYREAARRLRRLLPQALVVAFLAGGTSAFLAHDKAVRVCVDGTSTTVHTFADDVGELLDAEGVTVGSRDTVAPAPGTGLVDGDEVVVRREARGDRGTAETEGHRDARSGAGGGAPAPRRP